MKCEFCNKELATQKSLIAHYKTIACRRIQEQLKDKNNCKVEDRIFIDSTGIKIIQRGIDNYINLTAISSVANKRTDTWFDLVKTKTFIESLMKETNLSRDKLLIYERGTTPDCHFVHPKIANEYSRYYKLDENGLIVLKKKRRKKLNLMCIKPHSEQKEA